MSLGRASPRGFALAAVALAAWPAITALLASVPLARALAPPIAGQPAGDAAYFELGALFLLDVLPPIARELRAPALRGLALVLGLSVLALAPFAVALTALSAPGASPRALFARARRHLGTLALVWLAGLVARAAVVALGLVAGRLVGHDLGWGPPRGDVALAAGLALGVAAAWLVGLVADLASVACVDRGLRFYEAMQTGLARAWSGLAARASRSSLAAASFALAAALLPDVQRRAGGAAGVAWLVAAFAATSLCRVSWLERARAIAARDADDAHDADETTMLA